MHLDRQVQMFLSQKRRTQQWTQLEVGIEGLEGLDIKEFWDVKGDWTLKLDFGSLPRGWVPNGIYYFNISMANLAVSKFQNFPDFDGRVYVFTWALSRARRSALSTWPAGSDAKSERRLKDFQNWTSFENIEWIWMISKYIIIYIWYDIECQLSLTYLNVVLENLWLYLS